MHSGVDERNADLQIQAPHRTQANDNRETSKPSSNGQPSPVQNTQIQEDHMPTHEGGGHDSNALPPLAGNRHRPVVSDPSGFFEIHRAFHKHNARFNAHESGYVMSLTQPEDAINIPHPIQRLLETIDGIIQHVQQQLEPNDLISLTLLSASGLDFPVSTGIIKSSDLNLDLVLEHLMRVLNSNEEFVMDKNMELTITTISLPVGGADWGTSVFPTDIVSRSTSIVQIRNSDHLCCARALGAALGKLVECEYKAGQQPSGWMNELLIKHFWGPTKFHNYRSRDVPQRKFAEQFHALTGVPEGDCGFEQIAIFQEYLDQLGIGISVFSRPFYEFLVVRGDPQYTRNVYLYLIGDCHYHAIVRVPAFLHKSNWCHFCKIPYNQKHTHRCTRVCKACYTAYTNDQEPHLGVGIYCDVCSRTFKGKTCFELHKKSHVGKHSVCVAYGFCKLCKTYLNGAKAKRIHKCFTRKCPTCWVPIPTDKENDHKCYMQLIKPTPVDKTQPQGLDSEEDSESGDESDAHAGDEQTAKTAGKTPGKQGYHYITYDMETAMTDFHETGDMTATESILKVICVCANSFCDVCVDIQDDQHFCKSCMTKKTQVYFGCDSLQRFGSWLLHPRATGKSTTVFAHNMMGFDGILFLEYLYHNQIIPDVLMKGE